MSKRAIVYGRVSYDDRDTDGRNLQGQLDMGQDYCNRNGYTVVDKLAEDVRGASGADWDLPKLESALDLARQKGFDVLVVRELDRFARGLVKQLVVEQQFKQMGVTVEYVLGDYPDTPEGNLSKQIRGAVSEFERELIKARMTRGRRLAVMAGNAMVHTRPPLGLKLEQVGPVQTLVPVADEVPIIQTIFHLYVYGDPASEGLPTPMSIKAIAKKLTSLGIPTAADRALERGGLGLDGKAPIKKVQGWGEWSASSVAKILTNETYAGVWRYGKRKYTRPEGETKKKSVKNPDDYVLTLEIEPIISRELWAKAQKRLKENKMNSPRNRKYDYLLSGLTTCGLCGAKIYGTGYIQASGDPKLYYRCISARGQIMGQSCDAPHFNVAVVDGEVWDWILDRMSSRESILEILLEEQEQAEQRLTPLRDRLAAIEKLLGDYRDQYSRLLDLFLSGDIPKEMLLSRKQHLEQITAGLEQEQAALSEAIAGQAVTESTIDAVMAIQQEFEQIRELAAHNFAARRAVVELLNTQVTLGVEGGERVVRVRCILGERSITPNTFQSETLP